MTAAAPSGVVTFLFTDVEGSTRRWESDAEGMRAALAAQDEVLRFGDRGARRLHVRRAPGDGVCAAFALPRSALDAAVARTTPQPRQRNSSPHEVPESGDLRL